MSRACRTTALLIGGIAKTYTGRRRAQVRRAVGHAYRRHDPLTGIGKLTGAIFSQSGWDEHLEVLRRHGDPLALL
jgi:hypothetical protein